ncbi:MAG: sugar transferase [Rubripirellula sp.]
MSKLDSVLKRTMDIVAASLGLLVFSPVLLLIAALIWLTDGRPIFYCQKRIGKFGEPFTLLKFRSMRNETAANQPQITVGGDSRITKIGHVLRKTKVDELPQLLNVLLGQMSLVGPRPEVQQYVDHYDEQQRKVLELTPGITDPASLKYFNEEEILAASDDPMKTYLETVMPDKISLNLQYAKRASVLGDIGVILRTLHRVCRLTA